MDASGQVVEAIGHNAFGQRTDASAAAQSHRFAGEYWDEDAQLVYLRARWYDPKLGRFISGDPFEGRQQDPRSLNRYAYAHGDPVQYTDPSGQMSLGSVGAASAVSAVLTTIGIASTAHSVYQFASGETELTPKEVGLVVLGLFAGPVAGKVVQTLARTSVNKMLVKAISSGSLPKVLVKGGRVREVDLRRIIPPGTPNTFKPSATIPAGEKYQFTIDGVKMEVKWHAPDAVAAAKFPGSNSGSMWTAQIKADGKLVGLDGKMYPTPNALTHIPIDL